MRSLSEACGLIENEARPGEAIEVGLADAVGLVLAEPLAGDVDLPPFDRAAVDGYAVRAADAGTPLSGLTLNLFKTAIAENAVRAVEQALVLTGNHGLSRVNPLERYWRDVLCARVHTPQADSVHLAAGRAALGL